MAVVYESVLVVPETGEYTFSLDGVSDGAAIFISDNLDIFCCENFNNMYAIDAFIIFQMIQIIKTSQ